MIYLEPFDRQHYDDLISWVENEEELMQFAGPLFKFPLTPEQLDESISDKNRIAFRLVDGESNKGIGHAEIYLLENSVKLGRILIGDKTHRGRGLCPRIMKLLLDYAFANLDKDLIELNVFDWNQGAIKCYEKVGFVINPEKKLLRQVKDQTWTAINMRIDRSKYETGIQVK
jgi:RimJ/RimL family protein N-acetyltransferase